MTNEEKQLLLQDLCARLPHKQKVCYKIHDNNEEITETLSGCLLDYFKTGEIAVVKPYLRPMESMTEEEKVEIRDLYHQNTQEVFKDPPEIRVYRFYDISVVDWLNKKMFDYRGLIEKGLAIEVTKGMYQQLKTK